MSGDRFAAVRGITAGRNGVGPDANPFKRADRRDLWERGRQNGVKGGFPCGAVAPHPPTLKCLCGHCREVSNGRGLSSRINLASAGRYAVIADGRIIEAESVPALRAKLAPLGWQ